MTQPDDTPTPRAVLTAAAQLLRAESCPSSAALLDNYRDKHYPEPKVRGEMTRNSMRFSWTEDGFLDVTWADNNEHLCFVSRASLSDLAAYDATVDEQGYPMQEPGAMDGARDPAGAETNGAQWKAIAQSFEYERDNALRDLAQAKWMLKQERSHNTAESGR